MCLRIMRGWEEGRKGEREGGGKEKSSDKL